jgi:hypothetical protein
MSIAVMDRVWKHSKQKGSGLLLMLALADHANDNSVCWPGADHLAQKIRMSGRNTRRMLHDLCLAREIFRVQGSGSGRGNKTFYVVTTGLDERAVQNILEQHFAFTPIEARVAIEEWKKGDNLSSFMDGGAGPALTGNQEPDARGAESIQKAGARGESPGKSMPEWPKKGDKLSPFFDQAEGAYPSGKGDNPGTKADKSGGPYKEYDPLWNRHDPPGEPTHTAAAPAARVGVCSKFSLEECRAYADHLNHTGQGITNPGGYATAIYRSGEADGLIGRWLESRRKDPDINPDWLTIVFGEISLIGRVHPETTSARLGFDVSAPEYEALANIRQGGRPPSFEELRVRLVDAGCSGRLVEHFEKLVTPAAREARR